MKNTECIKYFFKCVIVVPALFLLLTACGRSEISHRLDEIDMVIAENPDSALQLLNGFSADTLSEADRNLLHLLRIKARDKAFMRHSSDSLINQVLQYYSSHPKNDRYAEALYYAGRVNKQLGDYPSALRYFREALDLLPENTVHKNLRGNVLSQTASLLNSIRLYKEALPYLQKVINLEENEKDTINLIHDLRLEGAIYMHLGYYDEAEQIFKRARNIAKPISESLIGTVDTYLAAIKYEKNDLDSALLIIRGVPEKITDINKNTALNYAARIYLDSNKPDTALIYSLQLIKAKESDNNRGGYDLILNTTLRNYLPLDSITEYNKRYSLLTQQFIDRNASKNTLIQNSWYNYQKHVKAREKSETSKNRLKIALIFILTFTSITLAIFLCVFVRNRNNILKLHYRLNDLTKLNRILTESLSSPNSKNTNNDLVSNLNNEIPHIESTPLQSKENKNKISLRVNINSEERQMRLQLKKEYVLLAEKTLEDPPLEAEILKSKVYNELLNKLASQSIVPYDSDIWKKLDSTIHKARPNFKKNIELLIGEKISDVNYQLAMLMKCRFKPSEIARLSGREKNTISTRKSVLRKKIDDLNIDNTVFEKIIRLL